MEEIGRAYAFFDCSASKTEIEEELLFVPKAVQASPSLEHRLIEGVENLEFDDEALRTVIEDFELNKMRYVLEATNPEMTSSGTAEDVAAIMNQAYQTHLYEEGEPFRGEIVYRDGNEYAFIE